MHAPHDRILRHRRFGLVLSGGGARGFSHAGCLRALEVMGYAPSVIVGVSMGAVVGAAYALNDRWYEKLVSVDVSGFPELPSAVRSGLLSLLRNLHRAEKSAVAMYFGWGVGQSQEDWGRGVLRWLTREKRIENGRVPVFVTATDLASGKRVVFDKGPAADVVYASAALAGVFPPAVLEGRTLVDGGYCDLAPVDVARAQGVEVVIAVDAATTTYSDLPKNGLQAMLRGIEICQNEHAHLRFAHADLVLRPKLDPPVDLLDFEPRRRCIAAGICAVRAARDELKAVLECSPPSTHASALRGLGLGAERRSEAGSRSSGGTKRGN